LRKLANAALQLARNIENPPLPENQGSTEVRHAAKAFNEMQSSILKHVQERGFILGAIAHDLQTPLTRLRLRLEKVKDPELKQSLVNDLTATQEMVREGLDFARLCSENIDKNRVDLTALTTAVCDNFEEAGHTIYKTLPGEAITIMGSAHLLTRCLNNVLNNAINYAQSPKLTIQVQESRVLCVISDDGPGIPEQELDNVLEPFRRLEDSRSRHTGGTGLGLSIARMIVEKHGGTMTLRNKTAPESGLTVEMDLPLN
jgi:signal transduction histidine kinase